MLDKITGKTPIAYVSPVVGGKVLRNRGGETRAILRPGYVKPKHEVNLLYLGC